MRDEPRERRIASGLRSIVSRKNSSACLQHLWLDGAIGYFWRQDTNAEFHTLTPEDGQPAFALQCVAKDWLLTQTKARLQAEHPRALRAKRFKLDTQFRLRYEAHLFILESLDPPAASRYFNDLAGVDMEAWGGSCFHNRVESNPDDPLILKYLEHLRGKTADPAAARYTAALADYQGALIYRQFVKKDAGGLFAALMLRPAGRAWGLNDLHELNHDELVDRFLSEASLPPDERWQAKRVRESYRNGNYERQKSFTRPVKKRECPR